MRIVKGVVYIVNSVFRDLIWGWSVWLLFVMILEMDFFRIRKEMYSIFIE